MYMCIFVVKKLYVPPAVWKIRFLSKLWPTWIKGNCFCFSHMQLLTLIPQTALSIQVY